MWQKNVRYLDYNATSGLSLVVREKLASLLASTDILANPSSRHRAGQNARKILYDASIRVANSLSTVSSEPISTDELLFTSSGTEANQAVLKSIAKKTKLIFIGAGEHSSSLDWALEQDQASSVSQTQIKEVPLLTNGQTDFNFLSAALEEAKIAGLESVGLSLTIANNETGVLLDIERLRSILQASGLTVLLHLDGSQAWGKINFDLRASGASFATFSAHKIGAPSGTGLIWIAKGAYFSALILGSQNHGLRGGSENVLGIAATGFAAESLSVDRFEKHTRPLTAQLERGLRFLGYPIRIWGEDSPRVPNTCRLSLLRFQTYENWVELLDLKGFAVSHGSACKAQIIEPSHVLTKMGASKEDALNSLRISFGMDNTETDVEEFLAALKAILAQKEHART